MRRRGDTARRAAVALALALAASRLAQATDAPAGAPALLAPELAGVEAAVREQLTELRRRVEELRAGGAPPEALATALGELGGAYLVYSLRQAAASALALAVELAPGELRWTYYLGSAHEEDGRLDEAAAAFRHAFELAPHDQAVLLRLARVELDRGRLDEAERLYTLAQSRDAQSAAAHHGLGQVAYQRGDHATAVEHFEKTLELQPGADAVHYPVALSHRQLGRLDRARDHLAKRGTGRVTFAEPLLAGLRAAAVGSGLAMDRGTRALAEGRHDEALQWFRTAVERAPENTVAMGALASVLAGRGDMDEAVEVYRRVLRIDPEDSAAHYNLGSLLMRLGAADEGLAHLRRAVELAPDFADAHYNLGSALEALGREREALDHYERTAALDPDAVDVRLGRARMRIRLGETEAAMAELREVAESAANPRQRAAALAYLGSLQLRRLALDEALATLRAALALDPGLVSARLELANGLGRQGRYDEAVEQLDLALAASPRAEQAHFSRAMALLLAGRDGDARAGLERAREVLPESLALQHALARVLAASESAQVRDPARALLLAEEVFGRQASVEHGETVAMALAALGRFDEAASWQRQVIARAESAARPPAQLAELRRRLEQYEGRRPVRAPWRTGG